MGTGVGAFGLLLRDPWAEVGANSKDFVRLVLGVLWGWGLADMGRGFEIVPQSF